MGIPFYFREIATKNTDTIINAIKQCNRLFLDFNSIIHCCSAACLSKDEADIFNEIYKYTQYVINLVKPIDLVYIAVDGVAPRAKIQQQRRRRYLSSYRTELINNYKKDNNIPISDWDSNCITPGTEFMKRLDKYLRDVFSNNKNVIISSHEEYGEGEHKIIQYIKNSTNDGYDVIYGLDADLIMLSLSCKKQNIYLMRESSDFVSVKNQHQTSKMMTYKYLNIDRLRQHVSEYLYNDTKINYMYDYIFICFMLGNDFIPNLSFLKIKNGAIELLCDIYKKVYEKLNENLIIINEDSNGKETFSVNYMFLLKIFENLSFCEDKGMKEVIEQYNNTFGCVMTNNPKTVEKFIQELEKTPLTVGYTPKIGVINPSKDSKWRLSYYYYLFGSISPNIMKCCSIQYIEGLLWTANYYFNMQVDMNWCYIYDYSPCISELYKYLCPISQTEFNNIQNKLKTSKPKIDSTLQMLMVLPPQSQNCVPKKLQQLYNSVELGCTHYFPIKFELTSFLKHQMWECIPKLPVVDCDRLQKAIIQLNQ